MKFSVVEYIIASLRNLPVASPSGLQWTLGDLRVSSRKEGDLEGCDIKQVYPSVWFSGLHHF